MSAKRPSVGFASVVAGWDCASSLSFLAWDVFITLDDEIKYIWQKPFVSTSYVYLFVRYFSLFTQISLLSGVDTIVTPHPTIGPDECRSWLAWQTVSAQIEVTAVELILILRVHALYGAKRKILMWLGGLWLLEVAVMTFCLALSVIHSQTSLVCETTLPLTILGYGAASIFYEMMLLIMLAYKIIQNVDASSGWRLSHILEVMLRDGLWAFSLFFCIILANALLYGLVKSTLAAFCFPWLLSVAAFVGYRLLLNMRKAAYAEEDERSLEMSTNINFESNAVTNPTTVSSSH